MEADRITGLAGRILESPEPTIVLDGTTMEVLAANPSIAELTGSEIGKLVGKPPGFLARPTDFQSEGAGWERTQRARLLKADGTSIDVEVVCLFVEKGDPQRVVLRINPSAGSAENGGSHPLQNRHQALHRAHRELLAAYNRLELLNDELENKNRQLQEVYKRLSYASKMAAVGELTAGATHGINNPLAAAVSAVRTISRHLEQLPNPLREKLESACRRADKALERIERIVSDLRRLAQAGTRRGDLKVVDLEREIRLALELISHKLKGIDITVDLPPGLAVRLCPDEFNQVIMNLADNAAAAMGGKGELVIRGFFTDSHLRIEVSDTGPGVPPELAEKIFEPFFSTKEPGLGTGIGLSVARGIIEGYAGTLRLEQEIGKGSTFVIELPQEVVCERSAENPGG